MTIERIKKRIPPPETPVENEGDWSEVESRFGHRLPDVFKDFISAYGTGSIGDFLWILNPFGSNPNTNFDNGERHRGWFSNANIRFANHPTGTPDFFPWALTDNGDTIIWLLDDADPNDWSVSVLGSRPKVEEPTGLNTQEFLEALFDNRLTSAPSLPEDFPLKEEMYFTPRKG